MKKFIIAFCSALALASCSMPSKIDVTYVDYNKYYQEGFLITPGQYYQEYEPCGEIFISVTPGYTQQTTVQTTTINNNGYNRYGNYVIGGKKQETVQQTTLVTQKGDKEIRTIDDVVEIAVKEAKERGANALSNFKCDIVYNPNLNTIIRYEISGFCIKRNN